MLVYRGLSVTAILLLLAGCSTQQVQDAAWFTAGAALQTAMAVYDFKQDDRTPAPCPEPVGEDTSRNPGPLFINPTCRPHALDDWKDAQYEAADAYRTAQRRAELDAALDDYLTTESDAGAGQQSVVFVPAEPVVPQQAVDRLDAALLEAPPRD